MGERFADELMGLAKGSMSLDESFGTLRLTGAFTEALEALSQAMISSIDSSESRDEIKA